jgi:hypothetical protein
MSARVRTRPATLGIADRTDDAALALDEAQINGHVG